jgi:hypothetical protein
MTVYIQKMPFFLPLTTPREFDPNLSGKIL